MFDQRTLAIRCFALLSLYDIGPETIQPILHHIRANQYVNIIIYRSDIKNILQGLESAGFVYKSNWKYGITSKGQRYLRDLCDGINPVLVKPRGQPALANFSKAYDKRMAFLGKSTKSSSQNPVDSKQIEPEVVDGTNSISRPSRPKPKLSGDQKPKTEPVDHMRESKFKVGQKIAVKNQPNERGVIIDEPFSSQGEWHYKVFFSAEIQRILRESDMTEILPGLNWVGLEELLRNLALIKLQNPLSNNLYALYASRTQFEVYQFRPAVKFLGNPDQRLLIADEVGLGKTIEAGIIYLELQARLDLSRVLVVCPSSLRIKWQDEMKLRFDEEFLLLDSEGLKRFIERFEQYGGKERLRGIVSLELLRRPEFTEKLEELPILFDLVIIDEAHHCRNKSTRSNALATILSDNADAMLLLTATPLQTKNEDLFNLLSILSPGEFDNINVFDDRLEPNQFVNKASQILATGDHRGALEELKKVERTRERRRFTGNPYYSEVVQTLGERVLAQDQLINAQRRLVELNTLSNVFTRTRKREIASKVPTRAAYTLTVDFTPAEAQFYNRIIQHVRQEFAARHGSSIAVGWATIIYERLTASCISAARKRFADMIDDNAASGEEESFYDPSVLGDMGSQSVSERQTYHRDWYNRIGRQPDASKIDTKFNIFWETLRAVLDEDDSSKIIVFAFFRGTIDYLYSQLRNRGVGVEYLHGGINVGDRPAVIDHFRLDPMVRVLISSDVGSEGLDFQFCNTIFNYDLPWNPMKVEQRIGRIDRFGQQSDKVRIYNLVIDNSIESRILMRLYDRIGLFKRAVGDIEAILGEQIRELSKKVYSSQLSPHQEEALADLASQNIIRLQQEMEEFEKQRLQFMGQEAIFSTLVEQTIESGNYMSEIEMHGLVNTFVRDVFPRAHLDHNKPDDGTFCLSLDHDFDVYIRRFIFSKRNYDNSARDFLRHLDPDKELPVTFSSKMASERKLLHFITPRHPLAQAAADYWKDRVDLTKSLPNVTLKSNKLRPGKYFFFLFLLESKGAESSMRLVPVAIVAESGDVYNELSRRLLRLIQTSATSNNRGRPELDPSKIEEAEHMALLYMTTRRDQMEADIRLSNEALVNARRTAVTQSYEAKRRRVEEYLASAREKRISRMREGQLRNMRAIYEARIADIDKQRDVSVSFGLALRGYATVVSEDI